ncbi:MAG: hypothetical protein ABS81_00830 [Pseudonocardia sp. SCN 72-86]|nr:MAG: hypothetical protein ABS81_00830 [Pseudonocardia sp. SCN 72-86]
MADVEEIAEAVGKVVIDHGLCTGHGRCYELEPERFEPDDEGYGQVVAAEVAGADMVAVRRVVDLCPEQAVRIEGLPGGA